MKTILSIPLLATLTAAGANMIPDSSFEYGNTPAFHRMVDKDYLASYGWSPDPTTAVDGRRSLRSNNGRPLTLTGEVNAPLPTPKKPWVFSVFLKADQPDTPVCLKASVYRFFDQSEVKKTVTIGTAWQRYELIVKQFRFGRRTGINQGPVNFQIEIPRGVTVWTDAVQWECGMQPSRYRPAELDHGVPRRELTESKFPEFQLKPGTVEAESSGLVPIHVSHPGKTIRRNAPCSTGILFPAGVVGSNTGYILKDVKGRIVPIQTSPLALHLADQSILSLKLDFETALQPGKNSFTLEFSNRKAGCEDVPRLSQSRTVGNLIWHPSRNPAHLWGKFTSPTGETIIGSGILRAVGIDNHRYQGITREIHTEFDGPLHTVIAARGDFIAEDNPDTVLLSYTARLLLWKSTPGVTVELTLINRHPTQVATLRDVYWEAPLKDAGTSSRKILQAFDNCSKKFLFGNDAGTGNLQFEKNKRESVALEQANKQYIYQLHLHDSWRRHPSCVGLNDGKARFFFWPGAPVQPLLFPPGMAVTRTGTLRAYATGTAPELKDSADWVENPPVALADPRWTIHTGLPLQLSPAGRFPLLDHYLENFMKSGSFTPTGVKKKLWFGMFDYGDHPGDGGWANLESYDDYAMLLRALRSGDPETLRLGLAAAEHYRDIDINHNINFPILHSSNHVNGGSHFGHAWIQGVLLHYLLTGSPRSREVACQVGEAFLAMRPNNPQIAENRELAYYLLTLADLCRTFGDKQFTGRFDMQLDMARKRLTAPPQKDDRTMQRTTRNREDCLFYWRNSGVVPFACWYGCAGLLKMHDITGDKTLLPVLRKEIANSLDMELTYRVHLEELYPNLPAEKTLPLIASDYVGGRGSYFYPVMAGYSRITGDPAWRDLAIKVAYARILEGKLDGGTADILMTAPFAALPEDFDETRLIREIRSIYMNGAAKELLNGDFRQVRSYAEMMTPRRPDAITPAWAKEIPYPRFWRFNAGKEFTATEFMRYRPELYSLSDGTLQLHFDRKKWYAQTINFDSARIAFQPGSWKFRGRVRLDRHTANATFHFYFSNFKDTRAVVMLPVISGAAPRVLSRTPALPQIVSHTVSRPDKNGFYSVEVEFNVKTPSVGYLLFRGTLAAGKEQGLVEVRELEFKPVE